MQSQSKSKENGCYKRVGWLVESQLECAGHAVRRKGQAVMQGADKVRCSMMDKQG